jgi:hypothetical protein
MTFVSTLVGKFWNRRGPEEFDASKLPGKIFGLTRKVWETSKHIAAMARYGLSDQTMEFAVATALASDGLLTGIPAVTEPNIA